MVDAHTWRQHHAAAIAEENGLDFTHFGYPEAWRLGTSMVTAATARKLPIAIAINFGEQRVFHAALPGSSATNDDWLARKFRVVAKHNCSSWALACRHRAEGSDYFTAGGYDRRELALAGGAVPLRVRGALIGAAGVSGLAEADDHRFVMDALRELQA
jgi:uncharacterized protein (UPF0303 family)